MHATVSNAAVPKFAAPYSNVSHAKTTLASTLIFTLGALLGLATPGLAQPSSAPTVLEAQSVAEIPSDYPFGIVAEKHRVEPAGPRILIQFDASHPVAKSHGAHATHAWLESLSATKSQSQVRAVTARSQGRFHVAELAAGAKAQGLLEAVRRQPGVEWAEIDGTWSADVTPNEALYDDFNGVPTDLQKWAYDGIGSDRNVNAESAWDVQTGRADVVIAILDSGTDWFYNDLFENLVTNGGEVAGDGIDNDGNGFVDDTIGWDFVDGDADATAFPWGDGVDNDGDGLADDGVFHGTFVASVAVARGNNGTNVVGGCWNCGLIPVRVLDDENNGSFSAIADGIVYAVDRGADVINLSLGGGFSFAVYQAIAYALSNDVVVVASAGNGNTASAQYPASFGGVIGVGASDSGSVLLGGSGDLDGRARFSNWGPNTTVVAPGVDLIGIFPGSVAAGTAGTATLNSANGTSFSAPLVSGLTGLVLSAGLDAGEDFSWPLVLGILSSTAVDLPDDAGDSPNAGPGWDGAGRVDFEAALDLVDLLTW